MIVPKYDARTTGYFHYASSYMAIMSEYMFRVGRDPIQIPGKPAPRLCHLCLWSMLP